MLGWGVAGAMAGPILDVISLANTTVAPGGTIQYFLTVSNLGDQPTDGSPLTLRATLPPGLTALSGASTDGWDCSGIVAGTSEATCTFGGVVDPRDGTRAGTVNITASVNPDSSGTLTSSFLVSGGGVPKDASTVDPTAVASAPPVFGVDSFDARVAANSAGDPYYQAGGHPYSATTSILFNTLTNSNPFLGSTWAVEPVKTITVNLPAGFVVNPTATGEARCTPVQLAFVGGIDGRTICPPGAQIGVTTVYSTDGKVWGNPLPVFNMVAPVGVPARLGFNVAGTAVTLNGGVRAGGDYGLTANLHNVPEGLALAGTTLTLWGVPSDPIHDRERVCPNQVPASGGSCTTEAPRRALLRNPTSCTPPGVGLATTLTIDSWFHPGVLQTASTVSHDPPAFPLPPSGWGPQKGITGCDLVPFTPSFGGGPDLAVAGGPAAFSFDVTLPQSDDPDAIATGDLKSASVTLPRGLRTSASIAGGLQGCSSAQIGLHSETDATCPGQSKIGTVTIDTPLLDDPLEGSIYLATPFDNPSKTLLGIYVVARGPGVIIKLAGGISPDPKTGQITTTFDSNPQLPFSKLHLAFKGGPRAPLSVPRTCGTHKTHAVMTSWSGKTVTSDSEFTVTGDGYGGPCAAPFEPKLTAGSTSVKAGKNTSLEVRLTRADTDEDLSGLTMTTPNGLTGKIAGVPLCPEAKAAAGTCAANSLIGSALTGAGAGPAPFYLPGKVYLTGPYRKAPFGLSIVVPAIAGPFDLGTVVVRTQIQVDRHTAQLRVVSDPLPTILQGIPLNIRDVRVKIDRAKFMLNPTGCNQKRVSATVTSTEGSVARLTDRFQVGGCSKLPLRPKLKLSVGFKGHTRSGSTTPFSTTLTQTPGQANLKSVYVSLPLTLNARLGVVSAACTQAEYEAGQCEKARAGSAVAVTPLLAKPLRGSAYFVKDPTKPKGSLPNLVVALRGQVDFDLVGRVKIPGGERLATQFGAIPDVPISSFKLSLVSGAKSPLGVVDNLCSSKARRATARVVMRGQNGAVIARNQRLAIRGCSKKR